MCKGVQGHNLNESPAIFQPVSKITVQSISILILLYSFQTMIFFLYRRNLLVISLHTCIHSITFIYFYKSFYFYLLLHCNLSSGVILQLLSPQLSFVINLKNNPAKHLTLNSWQHYYEARLLPFCTQNLGTAL